MSRLLKAHAALLLLLCSLSTARRAAFAQQPAASASQETTGRPILGYIDQSWQSLRRSMTDCKSVVDIKVTSAPLLYLPAGMRTPAAVASMQQQCKVEVEHLPRRILHLGDVTKVPRPGLLYLPHPYVVPGGRFNEMYGWDSYFILLGLIDDGHIDVARGIVENFFFEIDNYGAVLNANRTYFFTRSQPPLLSSMIREVYDHTSDKAEAKAWLATAYTHARRDYQLWSAAPHLAGDTGLARYSDLGSGPVPEMEDDSTYYADVIRWLLSHPEVHTHYLIDAPEDPDQRQSAELARTSCDPASSRVCARAVVNGNRLSSAFFHGDRAMRESGFDTTFRFGPFSGSTDQFAPVCLNSLLYKYERDMADFAGILGRTSEAAEWKRRAQSRKTAIDRYLWNAADGMFYDYNFVEHQPSTYRYLTTFYPLWAGLATPPQAAAIERNLSRFERDGGLAMSDTLSGTQWDMPYGWAPVSWLATAGLARYGYAADAHRLAEKFTRTVDQNYARDGTIREKYNVVSGSANVAVAAGYKANVIGFGWTNGVYLRMHDLLNGTASDSKRAGQPAAPQTP